MLGLLISVHSAKQFLGLGCLGKKGKMPLHNVKLHVYVQKVKRYVLKLYPSQASQGET